MKYAIAVHGLRTNVFCNMVARFFLAVKAGQTGRFHEKEAVDDAFDALLKKGYKVYATYVGNDFTEEIENYKAIKVDQSNRNELYKFLAHIKEECTTIDCIICNAGMSIRKAFT